MFSITIVCADVELSANVTTRKELLDFWKTQGVDTPPMISDTFVIVEVDRIGLKVRETELTLV